eukprot:5837901-Pyramimonas_sp.AAC.1
MAPRGSQEGPKGRCGDWAVWVWGPGLAPRRPESPKPAHKGSHKLPKKPQRRIGTPWLLTASGDVTSSEHQGSLERGDVKSSAQQGSQEPAVT